jgi:4'-phosphopantetheinyl transferase
MNVYWLEQHEIEVPLDDDWLSYNERVCFNAFRFAKRRADWRLGRWTAKQALAAYLDVPVEYTTLSYIEILAAPSGAPKVFLANEPADISISLSHSAGTAACAVAPSDSVLGCDLEKVEPRSHAFMADYLTNQEQAFIACSPIVERPRLVNLIWSAKESALKALQTGLRLDTRSVIVTLSDSPRDNQWHPLHVRTASDRHFHGWYHGNDNDLVRTLVAVPQPAPPVLLQAGALAQPAGKYR